MTLPASVTAKLSDGTTEAKTYVAKGETITFTLDGTFKVDGTEKTYDSEEVTLDVDHDIVVEAYETKVAFEKNVADAVAKIGTKDGLTGATITETADGWDVKITADYTDDGKVKNTGAMDALGALLADGYKVSVKLPTGYTYNVSASTNRDAVEKLLPGNGQSGEYTITISNGEFQKSYTVSISVSY